MSIPEADRHRLYEHLREVLDDQDADTLMAHLPPGGWGETARTSDLATYHTLAKADLDGLRAETKADLAEVRTELKGDIAELRTELKGDIAELRTELKGDIAELRTELKGDIAGLRTDQADVRTELYRVVSEQTRTMVLAIVASNATLAALAFGAARLA